MFRPLPRRDGERTGIGRRVRLGWPVLLISLLAAGWIVREQSLAQRQERTLPVLLEEGVLVLLEEPTALGQFLKKVAPGREAAVGDRIGAGWLGRPTVLIVDELTDARVRRVADLIVQLGTARELHLRAPQLSAGGRLEFSRRLAGVNLASSSVPAEQKYYRSRTTGAQFASGGAFLAALLAVAVPLLVIWGGWCVVKRLRPKPEAV